MRQRSDDPRLRRQLANAYFRVGQITREIDSVSDAIEAFRSAQALWEPLFAADPADFELQGRLGECHLETGKLLLSSGDFPAAQTSLTQARDLLAPCGPGSS